MKRFCVLLLVIYPFIAGYVQAVSVSKENQDNEAAELHKPVQTDEDQITELRYQVTKLQQAFSDITRSFSALELFVKEPEMAKNLVKSPKTRFERDIDTQSPQTPTSPLPNEEQNNSDQNLEAVRSFTWPLHSGPCLTCPAGIPGPRGPPGPRGIMGRDGRDGRDAVIQPEVQQPLSTSPTIQPVVNSSQSGVVYIRWGSSECPGRAELIYKGTIGGTHSVDTGGGTNYMCMPEEPIYDEIVSSSSNSRAHLYSSEYQTSDGPSRLQPRNNHAPTCAVCKAPSGRTTKLMIPARNVCPSADWRLEYAGYLMAGGVTQKRAEFVCVDRAMDVEPRSAGSQNGALLFMVEAICQIGGGLPCGPYVSGNELTCAVCTI